MSKLWGGRFSKKTNELVERFSNSIHFDGKLAWVDCVGSLVHIEVLKNAGLIKKTEHAKLQKGLKKILASIEKGQFKADPAFEDIHSYIQHCLEQDPQVGQAALKLHTCRSRNDQVVFDTKLYALQQILETEKCLLEYDQALQALVKEHKDVVICGYTHLQHAIPVPLAEHFRAYQCMLERDEIRLLGTFNNIHLSMGSGALAGTMIPAEFYERIEHPLLPKEMGAPVNSLDTVSDRDYVIESLSTLAVIGMHLSRLCEDMILWASKEFDFIDIDDAFCTGSSLMPQKKNPDVLELVRGCTGRLYGNLVNVLVVMKGLPLTYNRDMQHDKEPLFDSFKTVQDSLKVMAALLANIRIKKENIDKQLGDECLYATDIADFLVKHGVAFKEAHAIVGRLIQFKLNDNVKLTDLPDSRLKTFHPKLTAKALKTLINPRHSVQSKESIKKKARKKKGQ